MSRAGATRHNARRDENEREIVDALQKAGFKIDQISAKGFPDLVCIRRSRELPVFIVESVEQALDLAMLDEGIMLVEVKMPGKKLTPAQGKWHADALLQPELDPDHLGE